MTETVTSVLSPVYLIRSYVWEVLKKNDPNTWDESKYGGIVPIVPLSEEPELDSYTGPHIVYGYALGRTNELHVRKSATMTFVVYDQNFRRLTRTINILHTALGRDDETAADINRYTTKYQSIQDDKTVNPYHGLAFGYVSLGYAEGGTPEESEGGRQSALMSISFEYYVDYDVVTDVSS